MPGGYSITMTDAPGASVEDAIVRPLIAYNEARAGRRNYRPLAILVTDAQTKKVIGGLWAGSSFRYLYIDAFYLPEPLRGAGLGRQLITQAEEEARLRNCHAAWLDTFSFQARGFYEKLGYSVFGVLEDYPPGEQRYFMTKSLQPPR